MAREIDRAEALKMLGKGKKRKSSGGTTKAAAPDGPYGLLELKFFIPGMITQSLNTTLNNNISQQGKDKQRWYDALRAPLSYLVNDESRAHFWQIDITRYGAKKLDKTNLVGGMKPLEDALCYLGLMRDDDPDSSNLDAHQIVVPVGKRGMLIELKRGKRLEE